MELKKIKIDYVDNQTGEKKQAYNYYIVVGDIMVAVKPVFKNDYRILGLIANEKDK